MTDNPVIIALDNETIIDWQDILERNNQHMTTAEFVLINFVSELFHVSKQFNQAREAENWQQLRQAVDKLQRICNYCSTPRLQEAVAKFEDEAETINQAQWLDLLAEEMANVLAKYRQEFSYG